MAQCPMPPSKYATDSELRVITGNQFRNNINNGEDVGVEAFSNNP